MKAPITIIIGNLIFAAIAIPIWMSQPVPVTTAVHKPVQPASALVQAINAYRATKSLPALHTDAQLNASAQAKADDMVSRDYWSHDTPDGSEPWVFFDAAGYTPWIARGENLAKCYATSADVVEGWRISPTHNFVMTDRDYEDIGIGKQTKANGCEVVVAHFGSRDE